MILIKDLEGGASFEDKVASIRGTPEAVNIHNVWSNSSNRDFEKPLALSRLKELAFLFSEAVPDPTASNFRSCCLATAEPLDVIFVWFWHAPDFWLLRTHGQRSGRIDWRESGRWEPTVPRRFQNVLRGRGFQVWSPQRETKLQSNPRSKRSLGRNKHYWAT